jgi:hypothetical protein
MSLARKMTENHQTRGSSFAGRGRLFGKSHLPTLHQVTRSRISGHTEWLLALRRPEPVVRKKSGKVVVLAEQLVLPEFGATG